MIKKLYFLTFQRLKRKNPIQLESTSCMHCLYEISRWKNMERNGKNRTDWKHPWTRMEQDISTWLLLRRKTGKLYFFTISISLFLLISLNNTKYLFHFTSTLINIEQYVKCLICRDWFGDILVQMLVLYDVINTHKEKCFLPCHTCFVHVCGLFCMKMTKLINTLIIHIILPA